MVSNKKNAERVWLILGLPIFLEVSNNLVTAHKETPLHYNFAGLIRILYDKCTLSKQISELTT